MISSFSNSVWYMLSAKGASSLSPSPAGWVKDKKSRALSGRDQLRTAGLRSTIVAKNYRDLSGRLHLWIQIPSPMGCAEQ